MADPTVTEQLSRLILSATELKSVTDWSPEVIEDYLNILDNSVLISENLDETIENLDPWLSLDPLRLVATDAASGPESVSDLTSWIDGTNNKITSTDDGDGTLTISIDDDYLINNVLGITDEIEITDNLDGTIDIGIDDNYLFGNVIGVTDEIDITDNLDGTIDVGVSSNFRITEKTRITNADSPYTLLDTDYEIFANTDTDEITALLPAGAVQTRYRIMNTGTSGNAVTITPNGLEDLIGANSNWTLLDGESMILTYDSIDGWY